MEYPLQIAVLGKPHIKWQGVLLTADLVPAKGQALLVYLAVTGQTCSRQAISGLLWGDLSEERARGNLRLILNKLRNVVGDYLVATRQSLAFDTSRPYWLDTAQFVQACASREKTEFNTLETAVELYRGNFLEDFHLHDAPDFETWVMVERERFQQIAVTSLARLAAVALQHEEFEKAIAFTRRILSYEPWREEAHQQLMKLLAQIGQRSAALSQFEICRKQLTEELGVEPSAETKILYEKIRSGVVDKADGKPILLTAHTFDSPAGKAATDRLHNLPQQLTPFLGRDTQLIQIAKLLSTPECRLLTLVGPGGVGKTRLAINAAQAQVNNFRDGIKFLSLREIKPADPIETMELLIAALANAVGYTFTVPRSSRALLFEHLAEKEMLLLLDNFEPLLSSHLEIRTHTEQLVLDLLRECPNVKLFVTSRERINIHSEWLLEIQGLPYPPVNANDPVDSYPAVVLFIQQARRIDPNFSIENQTQAIYRICQVVTGFPLAIELAANWVRLLPCAEIVERLENGMEILMPELPDSNPPSMRSVLDSSWGILTESEQQVFRRLSVFRGGFTLSAAQQIAGASLPILNSLMNKSMLRRNEQGRYVLHELLKQFGSYHLTASPDEERDIRQKYGRFYGNFLQTRSSALKDPLDQSVLSALDAEIENIRAALNSYFEQGDLESIALYIESLWLYYQRKGWYQEAVFIFEKACSLGAAQSLREGYWRHWLGETHYSLGNFAKSERNLLEALDLFGYPMPSGALARYIGATIQAAQQGWRRIWKFRPPALDTEEIQKRLEVVRACERLLQIYWFQSQSQPMYFLNLFALNLVETVGNSPDLARIDAYMAMGTSLIPLSRVSTFYLREAAKVVQRQNAPSTMAWVLQLAGLCHLGGGEWDRAKDALEKSTELFHQIGNHRHWEESLGLLGEMVYFQGKFADAQTIQEQTLASARQRGDTQFQFHELTGFAMNAMRLGNLAQALDSLNDARVLLNENNGLVEEIRFYGVSAQAHLQQGEIDSAIESAHLAMKRIVQVRPTAFYALEGYAGVSEVYLAALENNCSQEALKSVEQAVKSLQQFGQIFRIGRPRAWLHQGLYHWLCNRPKKAIEAWEKSLHSAEQMAIPFETARAHFEIGRHLSIDDPTRRAHLEKAAKMFLQMGAKHDFSQAQKSVESSLTP